MHYIGDDVLLLFFCIVNLRLVLSKDWHGWRVEREYLPFTGANTFNKFVNKQSVEKDGDHKISDDPQQDTYENL